MNSDLRLRSLALTAIVAKCVRQVQMGSSPNQGPFSGHFSFKWLPYYSGDLKRDPKP